MYTIVRMMGITNADFTGEYHASTTTDSSESSSFSRTDVAHIIIKALVDSNYENTPIGIAKKLYNQ